MNLKPKRPTIPETQGSHPSIVLYMVLVLLFARISSTTGQDVDQLLMMDDSVVYELLHSESLSVERQDLQQAISALAALSYRDYDQIETAAIDWRRPDQPPTGPQPRLVVAEGALQSIFRINTRQTEGGVAISTPEEALELASRSSSRPEVFYVCELQVMDAASTNKAITSEAMRTDSGRASSRVIVITPSIPEWFEKGLSVQGRWKMATGSPADLSVAPAMTRVRFTGIQLGAKSVEMDEGSVPADAIVLAKRLAWTPRSIEEIMSWLPEQTEQGSQDWLALASQQMDVGLLSDLNLRQRQPLAASDNEAFYRLLKVCSDWRPNVADVEVEPLPVSTSILDPQSLVGRQFGWKMVVKQVVEVPLDSSERGPQLGIPRYYLVSGLVSLNRPLRLRLSEDQVLDYPKQFPVVLALNKLPEGLPVSDSLRRWMDAEGVFAKTWSYVSAESKQAGARQFSPLLIGYSLRDSGPPQDNQPAWPIGWLLMIPVGVGTIGVLWGGLVGWGSKTKSRRPRKLAGK